MNNKIINNNNNSFKSNQTDLNIQNNPIKIILNKITIIFFQFRIISDKCIPEKIF